MSKKMQNAAVTQGESLADGIENAGGGDQINKIPVGWPYKKSSSGWKK